MLTFDEVPVGPKRAATAKPTAASQFTALNHTGDPLPAGMAVPAMSMPGIDDIAGGALCWVLVRAGYHRAFIMAYIQPVASIIRV